MGLSRRAVFTSMLATTAVAATPAAASPAPDSLPDRETFRLDHVYLNAAYTHPMGAMTYKSTEAFLRQRMHRIDTPWPAENSRDAAVALFARLINADPKDIAVVPSTME